MRLKADPLLFMAAMIWGTVGLLAARKDLNQYLFDQSLIWFQADIGIRLTV
jgi:hypothetical protein